jgi:hypothetical protein
MLLGKVHNLRHFRLRHLKCIDPAHPNTLLVNVQHHPVGFLAGFVEKHLKHMNNKFHGREIIIQQQNLIERRFLCLWFGFSDDARVRITIRFCRVLGHGGNIIHFLQMWRCGEFTTLRG